MYKIYTRKPGIADRYIHKLWMIMRLTTIILIVSLLQVSAAGLAQRVTVVANKAPLENVLRTIRMQSGYDIFYDGKDLVGSAPVNISVHNASAEQAIMLALEKQALTYTIEGNVVVITRKVPSVLERVVTAFSQMEVQGRVVDEKGNPLSGANIWISGSNRGYGTGESGRFILSDMTGNETLITTYLGYKTDTLKLRGQKNVTIRMQPMVSALAEVAIAVNTGYQELDKQRATGSFSKPNMEVFSKRSGTMDVMGRLEGQIPGMTIFTESEFNTTTGKNTRKALVRGSSSVNLPTQPLYVVNGVVATDFSAINVNDIADITVLKDAAAAAIWGARAANGVVVVVTKSGLKNQRVKFSYAGFVDLQGKPDLSYQRYLSSRQYIQAAKEVFDPDTYPYSSFYYNSFVAPHDLILYGEHAGLISAGSAAASLDSLSNIDNKHQIKDLWYRNAITTDHTISASGGNNAYSFYASMGYTNVQSNTLGETNNTYRLNFEQNYVPNNRISISLSTQLANTITTAKNPYSVGADAMPYQLFKDASGNNINMPYIYGMSPEQRRDYQALSGLDLETFSPLDELEYGHSRNNGLSVNLVANTTVKLWKGLSYRGTFGYLTSPSVSTSYDDHRQYPMRKNLLDFTVPASADSPIKYYLPEYGGTLRNKNANQRNWTVRNQLVYNYSGREGKDLITVQGGQEASERYTTGVTSSLLGYDEDLNTSPLLDYLMLSKGVFGTVTGAGYFYNQQYQVDDLRSRFNSYFALASYTLNNKYSVDASWRVDHSNLFGSDVSAQNKPVWSFGAKWNLTEEPFMKSLTWLNMLAVRATYGITGNSPSLGAATVSDILAPEQYTPYPLVGGPAYVLSSAANRKLTWESTNTTNLGIDFGVFNRLDGSIEYYHKNTTSLLGSMPLDPFTARGSATSNIGNLTNDGINIGLNSINIQNKDFRWSTNIAFGFNRNKLVSYSKPQSYMESADYVVYANSIVGYPINPLFAYEWAGLDKVGDPQIRLADGTVTKSPQAAKATDLKYMGSTVPKYSGGIANNFKYKQLELTFNMAFNLGAVMRKDVNSFWAGRLTGNPQSFGANIHAEFADRWKKLGDENITNVPAYTPDYGYNYSERNVNYYTQADINVLSASYLKLRETSLSYHLGADMLRWLHVESASMRLQVNNILLWTANKEGIDPEFQQYSYGSRSAKTGQHTITIGANINF